MSSNNKSNEIIDLLSEIIINHLSKTMSIDNIDKFKRQ
ncbi:Uncharacterised protein [uncultured Clostridium sp.]|jgi:hypothetical protein|nr:Uncharacterised protein [uncultured Clostridium sp.]